MIKIKNIFLASLVVAGMSSCKDDMNYKEVDQAVDYDYVIEHWNKVAGFLPPMYNQIDYDFGNQVGSGAMLASATDEAVFSHPGTAIEAFYNGAWSPVNAKEHIWSGAWKGIGYANHYLSNFLGLKFEDYELDKNYRVYYERYKNEEFEARFVRAYLYFNLVKQYGGVPLITHEMSADESNSLPRLTADEVFQFVDDECEAIKGKIRKDYANLGVLATPTPENGKANDLAVMALQARAAMYKASPLFTDKLSQKSDAEKKELWKRAAELNQQLIDSCLARGMKLVESADKTDTAHMVNVFNQLFNGADTYKNGSSEIIFARRIYTADRAMEEYNFPAGMTNAQGGNCPSQTLVDAFEMTNGMAIDEPGSGYDPQDPFKGRDARLLATVALPGEQWPASNPNKLQSYVGGINGPNATYGTPTGYYLKKYLRREQVLSGSSASKSIHTWLTFRLAEFYLNYAECVMNYTQSGYDKGEFKMTAAEAINKIRNRAGQPDIAEGLDLEAFKARYENERFVEMAFEGHRFYDVRRWLEAPKYFTTIKTCTISKIGENTAPAKTEGDPDVVLNEIYSFEYNTDTETRKNWDDKMYLSPIPQADMNKQKGGWKQNPGW